MKKYLALLLTLCMLFALCACGAPATPAPTEAPEAPAEEVVEAPAEEAAEEAALVGVAMPTKDLQRWIQDGDNMKAQLEAVGYQVDLQYAANDIQTQVSQIENMIANGCKVLVIASIDGEALGTVLAQAKEAGIPVIAYDRLIMNSDAVSYYATFDNWDVGVKQGTYIAEALDLANAGDKTYNIEFITGDPGDNNINFFFGGAMEVLQPYLDSGVLVCPSGQTDIMDVATPGWASDAAQARFENILGSYYADGTQLHAVMANNDSTAYGVENALAAGYTGEYPIVTGQDCDVANTQNMLAGLQSMSVFKDTRTLASKVVEMVDALIKGAEPPINDTETYDNGTGVIPAFLCEPVACTADMVQELLIDSGYYTAEQLGLDAAAEATAEEPASKLIGVAMPTKDLQRWIQDGDNMKAQLEAAGYEVDLQYAANDIQTQVSQIENMIANGCQVLVIASIDGEALGTVLAQAKEAGIPVIAYDRLIMNSDAVSYYATFDNWDVGVKQGTYIAEALDLANAGDKTYNIEFITGDPGDNNINFFFGGAMEVLQPYLDSGVLVCPSGQTDIMDVATPGWASDAAQARFENILGSYYADGTQLHAVMANNDSTAYGVENALAAGYTGEYPIVTGQDCDVANTQNMLAGLQSMSVFKDTRTLASKVVEMVDALMKGSEPPINDTETYDNGTGVIPSFLCEPVACTAELVQELLIDSGYYTADQLGLDEVAVAEEVDVTGKLVGVAMPTKDLQRWIQDGDNMKAQLEAAGYEVDLQYAANDIQTQVSQIENMIANGCEVLVIASIDGEALGTVLAQAKEAGIPVIAYDRLIMNSDAVSYYATFDNWDVGVKQGTYIAEALDLANAGDKTYNIEFITGDPGDNNINFFFGGAMEVLQPYLDSGVLVCPSGQTDIMDVATPGWASDAAQARFENILGSYYADGTQLHAVMANNDSTAYGVENALAAGYTGEYPIVTGQDCDVANTQNMLNGLQSMSVFKDTRTLASKVVEMVDALMKGSEPPINDTETYDNGTGVIPSFLCEPVACTAELVQELLIDSGYYTADQFDFTAAAPAAEEVDVTGKLVGVAMPTKDLQRWIQDGDNMKAQLEAAGYEVDLQYAANDIQTQVSQIENMIANGCEALVIASIDGEALGTVLAQAKEAGIPVIAYDRLIMNSDAVSYYATFDNWDVGVKQGTYIAEALDLANAGDKTYNIEFITGDPGDNNINFFFGGAMEVLQPYLDSGVLVCPSGQTDIMDVATPGWASDAAQARFENILGSYYADGTQLHAVMANNDSTAYGVENALAAGYTGEYPIVTGQDCDVANTQNMLNGLQSMSVFKDTRTLASKVVEMVDALMKGSEPPINDTETYDNGTGVIPSFLCEPVACTAELVQELLIDSGYYTADQLGLEG